MLDENISVNEIKAHFTSYTESLKRFRVSAEQFFQLLHERNLKLENFEEGEDLVETEDQAWRGKGSPGGVEFLARVPLELKILMLQFAGAKGFFKLMQVSKQWHSFLDARQEQSAVKK